MPLAAEEKIRLLKAFSTPGLPRAKAVFEELENLHGEIDVDEPCN